MSCRGRSMSIALLAFLSIGFLSGCAPQITPAPGQVLTTQQSDTNYVNDAQASLNDAESLVNFYDLATSFTKHPVSQSALDKQKADFDAVQTVITSAQTDIASGTFDLPTFLSSVSQAMSVYRSDESAAKAPVSTTGPTSMLIPQRRKALMAFSFNLLTFAV